jgi:hypothetical protein
MSPALNCTFSCIVTLDRRCREQNPVAGNIEVNTFTNENPDEGDVPIYTDWSAVQHQNSAWVFPGHSVDKTVQDASGAFSITTSIMTMEEMVVTQANMWLESQNYTHLCILSDSMSIIWRVEAGCVCRQWLES